MIGAIIYSGLWVLVCSASALYFLHKDVISVSILFGVSSAIFLSLCIYCVVTYYDKPHHGENPTISDVAKNEAHIDTIYTICNGDTLVDYNIKWND